MNHEMACLHWSASDYAFCIKCFKCYDIKSGEVHGESGGCLGYPVSKIHLAFKEEFEQTGKIGKHYFDTTGYVTEHVPSNQPFIVTSLF